MREIKFRVWSEDQKTYDYKFPYNSIGDFYVNTRGKVFSDFGNSVAPEVRQEAFVVEQYTGLEDKNGIEIYEGDIVRIMGYGTYEVFWRSWDTSFSLKAIDTDIEEHKVLMLCEDWESDYTIIGNIHENTELLGGEE